MKGKFPHTQIPIRNTRIPKHQNTLGVFDKKNT
jgi:hypothetical protein